MAVINESPTVIVDGLMTYQWSPVTESDTVSYATIGGVGTLAGSVQVTGTFGSATVVLQGSNDGTNWVTLKDTSGTAISLTAAGASEFSTGMAYIRPSISGGSSQSLTITVSVRY